MKKHMACMAASLLVISMLLGGCGRKEAVGEDTAVVAVESTQAQAAVSMEETEAETEPVKEQTEDKADASGDPVKAKEDTQEASVSGDAEKIQPNGHIVCIDPGHSSVMPSFGSEPLGPGSGEYKAADASGTHGNASGLAEYELVLQVSLALRTELEKRGYEVVLTRENNETPVSCAERAAVATDAGADIFVRIHANGSGNTDVSGAMGLCITPGNAFHPELYKDSRMLTDDILNTYCEVTGIKNTGGVWETDSMSGNNWSTVPATILEMGYMTNPTEDQWMADEKNQVQMVKGIADGIDLYFAHQAEKEAGDEKDADSESSSQDPGEAGEPSSESSEASGSEADA